MLKKILFQLHWFLGITAGLVLALMGATGALQSFQPELLRLLNPGVLSISAAPGAVPLSPDALRERVQADMPGRRLNSLTLLSDPALPARAVFALPPPPPGQQMRRGELRWVDPFSGKVLPVPRGVEFFETVRELHRFLLAGQVGKQIVGACAMILVFLSLSGLYLRWPRQVGQWRAWFSVSPRQKGRAFLWNLHATLGTLALLCYLLSALTGMYWAVDVYRTTVTSMLGAPQRGGGGPQAAGGPNAGGATAGGPNNVAAQSAAGPNAGGRTQGASRPSGSAPAAAQAAITMPSLDQAREQVIKAAGAIGSISFTLPARPDQPLQATYLDADAPHDRAANQVTFGADGTLAQHQRYADKPAGVRLVGSVYPLHTGEFFGLPGRIILMLSALGLPVFAITGWMLYLDRRRKAKAMREARVAATDPVSGQATSVSAPLLIAYASQSGTAERLAWQTAHALQGAGVQVAVHSLAGLDLAMLAGFRRALFVVSTFGDGEAPDAARRFARQVMSQTPSLRDIGFGMLSLGDRSYAGFCGFGRKLQDWLTEHGAQPMFETIEVDNHNPAAIEAWQRSLGTLGAGDLAAWENMPFTPWTLVAREQVNVGSVGSPLFHLAFTPADGVAQPWQSGDLVEILPPEAKPGEVPAQSDPLRPRQYSIASVPADGAVHLLVRRSEHEHGLGLASGLLTGTLPVGATVNLRLRAHPGFQLTPANRERPLILIGNGSGLAGLMGHLRARIAAGQTRNWLVYGDRNAAVDLPYRKQLTAWQASGDIARMDLAFSRDQPERIYVQHKLADASGDLREWVERGAAIYVCGSLEGMAGGVDAVLHMVLGTELVDALVHAGRYRRDVY
jgi:sulfite reductase (NADPH) flavoprotein alpha-component